MKKTFVFLSLSFIAVLCTLYLIQKHSSFSLFKQLDAIYIFHLLYSIVLCWVLYFISKTKRFEPLLGFFYIASFILKGILFFSIFGNTLFNGVSLSNQEALLLLLPLFIALTFEVLFVVKILSRLGASKNA